MRIETKSLNESLETGCTDGKYRKARPDTTIAPGMGDEIVRSNRAGLVPMGVEKEAYGFPNNEAPFMTNGGSR